MTSKEALEKLYDGFQNGMAGRSFYDIIKQELDRLEELERENISLHNKVAILESENLSFKKIIKEKSKLEKQLKQTKANFKNSQTHSKNCYKNLKEIIKENFDYSKDAMFEKVYFKYDVPVMENKIIEVLKNDK